MVQHIERMLERRILEVRVFPLPPLSVGMNHDAHPLPTQHRRRRQCGGEHSGGSEQGAARHASSGNVNEAALISSKLPAEAVRFAISDLKRCQAGGFGIGEAKLTLSGIIMQDLLGRLHMHDFPVHRRQPWRSRLLLHHEWCNLAAWFQWRRNRQDPEESHRMRL